MADQVKTIECLARLLDAESPVVRQRVRAELVAVGPALRQWLEKRGWLKSPEIQFKLSELARQAETDAMMGSWLGWIGMRDEYAKLEKAAVILAELEAGRSLAPSISHLLDDLAQAYLKDRRGVDPLSLNRYLFVEGRLRGGVEDSLTRYSNLHYALTHGRGLPITLASVMMLCGARLGLRIQGCNLPGRFMAHATVAGRSVLFDCFHEGKVLNRLEQSSLPLSPRKNLNHYLYNPPSAIDIAARMLNNLMSGYVRDGSLDAYRHCLALAQALRSSRTAKRHRLLSEPDRAESAFEPGCLVRHKKLGYRAVVVARDERIRRLGGPGQERRQPWCHLLLAGSGSAYTAEASLEADETGEEIHHPLIPQYFERFNNGRYRRNDKPWVQPT